jgi:hypothetical protein
VIRRAVERQRYCALVGRGRRIVLTEMGGCRPPVGEGPERHRPKSRRSLPPSMPSTVTHEDFEHFYEGRRTGRGADPYFLRSSRTRMTRQRHSRIEVIRSSRMSVFVSN